MPAPFQHRAAPGWTRFNHGAFECTVVTDGQIRMGAPHTTFHGGTDANIDALLHAALLPTDRVVLEQNVLLVNTGDQMILFDCGAGNDPRFGGKTFGSHVGRTLTNLQAAGIDPESIDVIALTHAHSDHCWGLVDAAGRPVYRNARIAVSDVDVDYWTDLARLDTSEGARMSDTIRDLFLGAHKSLSPYLATGRVTRLSDGQEVAPGITAHLRGGHSPGHLMYRIESERALLTVWGDVAHHPVLLLAHPEWGFIYDFDQVAAAKTRVEVFDEVVATRSAVLAYHFPFPGRGHLQRTDGRLHWIPLPLDLT